jgi:predicted dehydrogenase
VIDFRRILDDPDVNAVIIATPDHWHTPMALLAIQAGKHVYVEKPCGHNLREGRLLRDASQNSALVVQHGTQARSCQGFIEVMQMLREGIIGDVIAAKAWNIQRRDNIGHAAPSDPPAGFDYDMWLGPAEEMPFQENRHHYNWHWWYNYGCGGMGNDGIHHIDYARWGLGVVGFPTRVAAIGGKYFFDDDQQFPDTQQVIFEYPGDDQVGNRRMLTYEQRLWSKTYPFNVDSGAEFYGTEGEMFVSARGKFRVLGPRNQPIKRAPQNSLKYLHVDHLRNWIDCIHDGKQPHAPMDIAHETAGLVHLGNIAARVGRTLEFDPKLERIVGDDEANALLRRRYRATGHWAIPSAV